MARTIRMAVWIVVAGTMHAQFTGLTATSQGALLDQVGAKNGVCVFVGLPDEGKQQAVVKLAEASDLSIYVQSVVPEEVAAMRQAAKAKGLLGKRIWVDQGPNRLIQAANNIADAVFVGASARGKGGVPRDEVLRVLHPRAKGFFGKEQIVKPVPKGLQPWSHPYHSPDNNTQSTDQVARYPYLTQFLGEPMFGCISEVTVAAGGRVFRAFGHIAFKKVSNEVLNKLYAINGYNGAILWTRPLHKGFMIHRNTMVATEDTLFLADNKSCKLIDARTGKTLREIKPPVEVAGGTVWKWMALEGDVLYAMIGGEEVTSKLRRGDGGGYGGWPWAMWKGYDYKDPSKAWGFGRNLLAIQVSTGKVLWSHKEEQYLDGRALCMKNGRIYGYSPDKHLICLDTKTGKPIWKNSSSDTLKALGKNGRAQGYIRGFSTTCYMKSSDDHLFFAGPQRSRLTAISTKDGRPAWTFGDGNFQIILREKHLYAFGKQGGKSYKLEPATGKVLAQFAGRRACTRATGSIDSLFCRANGGTIRLDPKSDRIEHIAPMRPACHDGVIVSEGHLYWGPWICACKLSLFGHIGLGPAGKFDFAAKPLESDRLTPGKGDIKKVTKLAGPDAPDKFTAGDDGIVVATRGDKVVWKAYTAGSVNFPPVLSGDRVYVGSNDGRVYAFEAVTGRLLWRFRAAPQVRRINVYGQLMSTWPVAGGVAVKDGVVYAAAGIAHFDGTHVFALDAVTGKIKWHNGDSGSLNPKLKNGVSLTGPLSITGSRRGEEVLQFAGGNVVGLAQYDLKSGKCLSAAPKAPTGTTRSTFYIEQWVKRRRQQQ
jgi:outer membrane protein assembly factor BamB